MNLDHNRKQPEPSDNHKSASAPSEPNSRWRPVDPGRLLHEQVLNPVQESGAYPRPAERRSPSFAWLSDADTEPETPPNHTVEADITLAATLRAAQANVRDRLGTSGTVNADAMVSTDPRHRDRLRWVPPVDPQPLLRQVLPTESSFPSSPTGRPLSPPLPWIRVVGYLVVPVGVLVAAIALMLVLIGA